jgi:hypothetical protein
MLIKYSTIQQCHRIINKIKSSLEGREYGASVFLDVQQAFDKVWHEELLYNLKTYLPERFYIILKSYLNDRYFQVKLDDDPQIINLLNQESPRVACLVHSSI